MKMNEQKEVSLIKNMLNKCKYTLQGLAYCFKNESSFLFVTIMLQDYIHINDVPLYSPKQQEKLGVDILTMPMEEKIQKVLYFVRDGELLCTREREILELILANKKRKEIALELYLSENTIKTYTRTLYSKLGVSCREELYSLLLEREHKK